MISVYLITKQDLLKKLKPYGCELIAKLGDGVELWTTGWGTPFTLTPEETPDGPKYDQWSYQKLLGETIARTMPEGWNSNGTSK